MNSVGEKIDGKPSASASNAFSEADGNQINNEEQKSWLPYSVQRNMFLGVIKSTTRALG